MANQSNIALKAEKVSEVQKKIEAAASVVVIDYRGYTVDEINELRSSMRNAGIEYVVLKNAIVERAAKAAGVDEAFIQLMKGPSAFAFSNEDVIAPAKTLKDFMKKTKKGEFKGGIIDGKFATVQELDRLADLPPRDVLLARLLGSMKAPISKLAIALNQIKEKLEKGDGTAEEVAAE